MKTQNLAEKIIAFNKSLKLKVELPRDVDVMNPFTDTTTRELSERFYRKYYSDNNPRVLLLGINPGRFGAGVTGIPFTDPVRLEEKCGIANQLEKKPELSSQFVYRMIDAFGDAASFYSNFLVSAVSPLGFLKNGKNLNYYDSAELQKKVEPFILECLREQMNFGNIRTDIAVSVGGGKNFKYLRKINSEHQFFTEIIALQHPRYIMQYKRKYLQDYISEYVQKLGSISGPKNEL